MTRTPFYLALTTLMLIMQPHLGAWASIHVSPSGAAGNPGTADRPVATFEQARDAVRALKRDGKFPKEGVTVEIHGGTYLRTGSFQLTAEDSGTTGGPVVYAAAPGEKPVLFGGEMIKPEWFSPVTDTAALERVISREARGKLLRADLKAHGIPIAKLGEISRHGYALKQEKLPPAQLYIGGERMMLARWPNPGDPLPAGVPDDKHIPRSGVTRRAVIIDKGPDAASPDFNKRGGTFSYAFARPELWTRATDVWLDGIFAYSWEWSYNQVERIDPIKKHITLRHGEHSALLKTYSGDFFFAENLLEEIDLPGEYYIDRAAGSLYLLPPADFVKNKPVTYLSALGEPMIAAKGASHLIFRGLTLSAGRSLAADFEKCADTRLERCEIRDFANAGIRMDGRHNAIVFCHLHHIGGTAITLRGGNFDTLEPSESVADGNHIHDWGWYHKVYHPGIELPPGSVGCAVSRNLLHNAPHMALTLRGNDHRVEYNEFHSLMETFADMGAIYATSGENPLERGNLIRRNYFHDIGKDQSMRSAIYPDNGSMGWAIEENIFARIGSAKPEFCVAVHNNTGADILTRNNLFIDCPMPYILSSYGGSDKIFGRNSKAWDKRWPTHDFTATPHARKYPELKNFWTGPRQYPDSNVFENNLIFNKSTPLALKHHKSEFVNGALDQTKALNSRGNWITAEDPGFADLKAGDLNLKANAAVFNKIPGFKPIPFGEIGPREK